ncbi:MAG: hypothetical protein WB540_05810 [Pseudolabrys sp.]
MSDQEAGDHKKDVDADKTTLETGDAGAWNATIATIAMARKQST